MLFRSKPVVMAVNGPAAGVGFVLAMTGDIRFAAPSATFISAFVRLGLVAEYGSAWLLPRLVGQGQASEILLSGRTVDAAEALRMGLVERVSDDPLAEAVHWARQVAAECSPTSLATIKRQLLASGAQTYPQSLDESLSLMRVSFRSPDIAEALLARAQKRPVDFGPRTDLKP